MENAKKRVIQDINYTYDLVGNILNTNNTAPIPAGGELGGPTEQNFTYDHLYQLITANGSHTPGQNKRTSYANTISYDIIGNILLKAQQHLVITGADSSTEPRDTNYTLNYGYKGSHPHAVTETEDKLYTYDQNGNMTAWTSKTSGAKRTITWNEENRVKSIADSGSTTDFLYDDAGERAVKRGQHGESVYINRFYAVKNGDLGSKHVFAGETRIVTKLEKDGGSIQSGVPGSNALIVSQGIRNAILQGSGQKKGINRRLTGTDTGGGTTTTNPPIEKFEFFYHGDHLGSSSFITDDAGAVYQHLEYFPYGESWVEEGGSGQMPYYRFTGKELDPETGLYYYGARYYDPVLSRWISADPAVEKFLPRENKPKDKQLPGLGGIYNSANLGVYGYSHNNPVVYTDPDGLLTIIIGGTGAGNPSWGQQNTPFNKAVTKTFVEQAIVRPWSGGLSDTARTAGAKSLYNYIKAYSFKPGEKLNIIAHSHGGNVVKEYSQMKGARKMDTVVNFGAPQRSDYTMKEGMVDRYINVYSQNDIWQTKGGFTMVNTQMDLLDGPSVQLNFKDEIGPAGRIDNNAINIDASFITTQGRKDIFNPFTGQQEVENYTAASPVGHSDLHSTGVWQQYVEPNLNK